MPIESIRSVFARIVDATELLMRDRARKRRNAIIVRHIASLPAYLRRDIGIPDDVEIGDAVEHGTRRETEGIARRSLAIVPHAV